jgi:hypothetical protein
MAGNAMNGSNSIPCDRDGSPRLIAPGGSIETNSVLARWLLDWLGRGMKIRGWETAYVTESAECATTGAGSSGLDGAPKLTDFQ